MNSRSLRPVLAVAATAAALIAVQPAPRAQGQGQRGPAVEKTFGEGLPRDIDRIVRGRLAAQKSLLLPEVKRRAAWLDREPPVRK